ncbi:hypothetical protein ACEWY4_017729 [Coilia grayii]|uniref:C2H2-type domain-containing protein n=1 Tax=Coilia grayii TaxID=363190 RepID=A0ABD1JJX0_9TELE
MDARHKKEGNFRRRLTNGFESSKLLRLQVEDLQKKLKEKENKLTEANKTIRALSEKIQVLQKKLNFEKRNHEDGDPFRSHPARTISHGTSQVFVNQPSVSKSNPTPAVSKSLPKHPTVKVLQVRLVDCQHELQPSGVLKLPQKKNSEVNHEDRNSDHENECAFSCMEDSSLFETQSQEERLNEHYSCGHCSRTFSKAVLLNLHIRMGHLSHISSRYSGGSCQQVHSQGPSSGFAHSCHWCGKTFSQSNHLKLHQRIHKKSERHVQRKKRFPKPTDFPCNQYSKAFSQANYLKLHQRTHKKAPKSADCIRDCSVSIRKITYPCDKLSRTFSEVGKNMAEMHTGSSDHVSDARKAIGEVTYPCGQCGKTFSQSNNLKLHQRVHDASSPPRHSCSNQAERAEDASEETSENTPPPCGKCGKIFSSWAHLQIHNMQHGRDELFPCPACHKTFATSSYLQAHQRKTHEGETNLCGECGRGFSHLSSEKPDVCVGCTEAHKRNVLESTAARNHERRWRDERPFPCTSCDSTFSQLDELQQHLRLHAKQSVP